MASGFQRTTQDGKTATTIDFKGFDGLSWMVLEVLMVRRPESNKAHNLMFYNYYLNKKKSKDHQNDPYSEVYQNNLEKRLLT